MSKQKAKVPREEMLNIELVDRPERVTRFDIPEEEIEELAASIKERGLLQAIRVNEKNGRFEIVFGDRRYLAHIKLGLKKIRAMIGEYSAREIAVDRATENNQRANLSPIEQASEYANLRDEHKMSFNEIGQMLGQSGGVIKRRVALLSFAENIQRALHSKKILIGVAEELARCPDAAHRDYLLEMCVEHGVTVAVVREWINEFIAAERRKGADIEGGGGELVVYGHDPIYKACELCKEPVDIQKMRSLYTCPSCLDAILKIVRGEA